MMTQVGTAVRTVALLDHADALIRAEAQVNRVLLGKQEAVRLAFTCMLAGGHLLIEDLPGMGKTTLAHALAVTLGLAIQRVQFTSDLLPSDIIGVSIYDRDAARFTFHPGPVFSQVLLADEINRATPKTQSALLEAMAEQQVTVDGTTHPLPSPFFVVATQNPVDLAGTFPLPDSQLDRFLLRIGIGYPDPAAEREMLGAQDRRDLVRQLLPMLDSERVLALRGQVGAIHVSPALVEYVQALLVASRRHPRITVGLSPRAGLALLSAARAAALLNRREFALPEDVQYAFPAVAGHRLVPSHDAGRSREELARELLASVPVD